MATVKILKPREQAAHFGLYRTSTGSGQVIFVRRKAGEPTDYQHTTSQKLKRQRYYLTLASQHYSRLTPTQKGSSRHQFEEMPYQKSHGKTDVKLLTGRPLFISREMRSLATTGQQLLLPLEICMTLCDPTLYPLDGDLWVRYFHGGFWHDCPKDQLAVGSWLFTDVPSTVDFYRVYGEAEDYFDPILEEHQWMTQAELKAHHYHILQPDTGRRGWSFYSRSWRVSWQCTPFIDHSGLHFESTIYFYDYYGDFHIALWSSGYPYPPEDEIARKTYHITPADPDPKVIYTNFSGLDLHAGVPYWHRFMIEGVGEVVWHGIVHFWEIY